MSKKTSHPKKPPRQKLPAGWTEKDVRDLADYYDNQSAEEQAAEHAAAYEAADQTMMGVPTELVAEVRKLIACRRGA